MHLLPLARSRSTLSRMLCAGQSCPTQEDMANDRSVLNQRAFQDVPRTLRRRSASHNVKRVPKPLRAKAKWEMVVNKTKPVHTKVRGRKRLRMEKRRLEGKSKPADETTEEMQVDDISEERGNIPKLKPRKVVSGKYAKRQGMLKKLFRKKGLMCRG